MVEGDEPRIEIIRDKPVQTPSEPVIEVRKEPVKKEEKVEEDKPEREVKVHKPKPESKEAKPKAEGELVINIERRHLAYVLVAFVFLSLGFTANVVFSKDSALDLFSGLSEVTGLASEGSDETSAIIVSEFDAVVDKCATQLGINDEQFAGCLGTMDGEASINEDQALSGQYGVTGTPTFIIDGEKAPGVQSFENFKEIIDRHLEGKDKITILEFSEYQCPFCAIAEGFDIDLTSGTRNGPYVKDKDTLTKLLEEYGDKIKLEFHLKVIHGSYMDEFVKHRTGALCAGEQGLEREFNRCIFENNFGS